MFTRERMPMVYTRAELVSDAVVHVVGIVAALIALPMLVWLASSRTGDASMVLALVVYGVSVLVLLVCSALNNMLRLPAWKPLLSRIDQSAIYVKIAGSYTPFAVIAGSHAGVLLAGLWSAALVGTCMRMLSGARLRWASITLYLLMGWAGALLGGPMVEALSPTGALLILAAGITYTLGVVFFVWEALPFHNTIWHVFVLVGSCVLYAAVLVEVSGRAGA